MSNRRVGKPKKVVILGIEYSITYCDKASDVDCNGRVALWGQIDYWTRSIRVYDGGRSDEDIWGTIIHECLHGIGNALNIKPLEALEKEEEDTVGLLALALVDVLFRNNWITRRRDEDRTGL